MNMDIVMYIVSTNDFMSKEFVISMASGAEFCKSVTNEPRYATSEICFIRFSLKKGIIDQLTLYPEITNITPRYRQHLYEDLEENVGWKPDSFRNDHSIEKTIYEIRSFFNNVYDPIYVPTKDHLENFGLGLYTIFVENDMSCPWIESFDDWGRDCKIYQMEYLIASIFQYSQINSEITVKELIVSDILDQWLKLNMEIAPETYERHVEYGLANQCCSNLLAKFLYAMSEDFYRDLNLIMPQDNQDEFDLKNIINITGEINVALIEALRQRDSWMERCQRLQTSLYLHKKLVAKNQKEHIAVLEIQNAELRERLKQNINLAITKLPKKYHST